MSTHPSSPPVPLSRSLTLHPAKSPTRIFLKSQFCTTPRRVAPLTPSTPSSSSPLTGKTALITGGSAGLGFHAARHLLALGLSRLILAVRSPARGEQVAVGLREVYPAARVEVWELEMGDYESIGRFVRRVEGEFGDGAAAAGGGGAAAGDGGKENEGKRPRLDIAVLNAGMASTDFVRNARTGHCEVVQVNFLGTFLLAILLLPVLRNRQTGNGDSGPGRLSIVSSGGVFTAKLPNRDKRPFLASFDDVRVQPWDAGERYFSSKVLGMLFFVRLLEHLPPADEVVVNLVDPGFCNGTELHRDAKGVVGAVLSVAKTLSGRSLEDGAWTYVDAAVVKGKESHGCFVMDWEISPFHYAIYEPRGQQLMDTLFEETMAEFEFVGFRGILQGLKEI